MPISEDEYERQRPNQSAMSKAEQRRNNKPIMEKRRRARINHCLNELKTLILDAMKKDPARHSKLEKADILEMTVKHLQTLQRQQLAVAVATDPNVLQKFKTGFNECAGEVSRYIGNMDGVEIGVKQRLVAHLSNCVTGLQQPSPFTIPGVSTVASNTGTVPITISQGNINSSSTTSSSGFNGDVNNNQNTTRIQVPPGIQLIPSRLPTGELALLVPNSSNMPFFSSSVIGGADIATSTSTDMENQRPSNSAFTTVRPKHSDSLKMSSPPLSPASSTTSFDDHQVTENFHRPRTPSPKEVTISFPTPPGSMHNPSGYKLKTSTIIQDQSPPQQFQVTSTSYSPENKEYGLKIEYKAVPIYQPQDKAYKQISTKSLEPLSVITSDKSKLSNKENYHHHHHQSYNIENSGVPINRKRPYPNDSSEGLLVVANHDTIPSTSKYARYSLDNVSTSSSSSSSGSPDQRFFVENHFHQPSTSGYGNNQQGDTNNEHMWRPW